jgi:O-antigen/teichoic acid export membrane protein
LPLRLLEFLPLVFFSIGVVSVSESFSRNKRALATAVDAYYRVLFMVVAPISVGGALLGSSITYVLFGSGYQTAGHASQYFFALFAIVFLSTPFALVLRAWEKLWIGIPVMGAQAVINVGCDFLLIPPYGLWGAVVAVTITFTVSTVMNYAVYGRVDRSVRTPWSAIGRCYLACTPLLVLAPFSRLVRGPLPLLACFLGGIVLWMLGARLTRLFGPVEQRLVRAMPLPDPVKRLFLAAVAP